MCQFVVLAVRVGVVGNDAVAVGSAQPVIGCAYAEVAPRPARSAVVGATCSEHDVPDVARHANEYHPVAGIE